MNSETTFEENEIALAKFAKALGHPARIAIIKILADKKVCTCGEIVAKMPISQSTVSQHLQELKNAGLVLLKEEGTKSFYTLKSKGIAKAEKQFKKLFKKLD